MKTWRYARLLRLDTFEWQVHARKTKIPIDVRGLNDRCTKDPVRTLGKCGIRKHERSGRFLAWKEGMLWTFVPFFLEQKTWWRFAEALVFWQEPTSGTDPFKCQQAVRLLEWGSGGWGWNHCRYQFSILCWRGKCSKTPVDEGLRLDGKCPGVVRVCLRVWFSCHQNESDAEVGGSCFSCFFLFATSSQPAQAVDLLICNQKRFINIPLVFGSMGSILFDGCRKLVSTCTVSSCRRWLV